MIDFDLAKDVPSGVDLVVEGVTAEAASSMNDPAARLAGFEGKPGQTALVGGGRLVVGLGPEAAVGADVVRRAAAGAARAAARASSLAVRLPVEHAQAVAEGFALGAYGFTAYRSDPKPNQITSVCLIGTGGARVRAALERGARLAAATCVARDLVNEPAGLLTAAEFASRAAAAAEAGGVAVEVLDEKAIRKANLAGLLAVNRGSANPPRFVSLTYEPDGRPRGTVALVGKGVTFDSGGLSLKTAEGMLTMKGDMGGGAAVIATMSALRDLGVKSRVRAYVPLTDNMTGGDAQRVGDVIRFRNGRTAEVLNTDAEGRLILADALCLASEDKPDAIVDVATLTGACEVALGKKVAGLFTANDGLADQLLAAASAAGEPVWRMPIIDAYRKEIDSKIADMKNTGPRHGGAIMATLFLREFVGDGIPWAHLDIAGPAFADSEEAEIAAGGTGFGVRTLASFLTNFRRP